MNLQTAHWPMPVLSAAVLWACTTCVAQCSSPLEEGIAEFNAGHYEKAVGLFGEAEPTNFNDPVFHYYLGSALVKLNHKPDAIKQFKIALDLEPTGQVAEYCKKALDNLADRKTGDLAKPDSAGAQQTPQIFAMECGCPLCQRLELFLADIGKVYRDKLIITRYDPAGLQSWRHSPYDLKNQAIVDKYHLTECPTLLVFGSDGQLVGRLRGVVAERDLWQQVGEAVSNSTKQKTASTTDAKIDEMKATIFRDAEAKVAAARKRQDDEINRLRTLEEQDLGDLRYYRRASYAIQQITADYERRMQQVREEFQRRRQEIMDDANSRASSIGH